MGDTHIHLHVTVEHDPRTQQILDLLHTIIAKETTIMTDLSAVQASVTNATTVEEGAVALLGSLSQQIRDLSTDPAALQALADSLDASTTDLAAAITANTPAAPAPTPSPEPAPAPTPPAFVAKIDGEMYADYVARANAAGFTPADEATWNALPVG